MSFVDEMAGAWIERQHSNAAARQDAQVLGEWMTYARGLEEKVTAQQRSIQALNISLEDARSSARGWKESALERLSEIDALRNCAHRSEEHTSELQSLMRISYAVFCLHKKIPTYEKSINRLTNLNVHSIKLNHATHYI